MSCNCFRMFPWRWLALLALIPSTLGTNAGVKVKLTEKGIEFGREIVVTTIKEKLKTLKVHDITGTQRVAPIGMVQYTFSQMQIVNLGLPKSALVPVPGTGVDLSITDASISLHGNWRVKYLRVIKNSGTFDLGISGLAIKSSISIRSDETGRLAVAGVSCTATLGAVHVKIHGGASWLYSLFKNFIDKALLSSLQKQICPLVTGLISNVNQHLKMLNVVAPVDKNAEIEYSMVSSPEISNSSIGLSLKGEFYNIGKHLEPPFAPTPFFLPAQVTNMMYIGLSDFTANSAGFVYNRAGALTLNITDDMIPPTSPIRLTTTTFGAFIPQIAKLFPGLKMKLLVTSVMNPVITYEPANVTVGAVSTVTAYAIHTNSTLSPLFVLNMEASVSATVYVTGKKVAGAVILNEMTMSLGRSYVGDFQVSSLDNIFQMVLKVVVFPRVNAHLQKGYPLPSIGKMNPVNTQLQVLKGYILIGTDVQLE